MNISEAGNKSEDTYNWITVFMVAYKDSYKDLSDSEKSMINDKYRDVQNVIIYRIIKDCAASMCCGVDDMSLIVHGHKCLKLFQGDKYSVLAKAVSLFVKGVSAGFQENKLRNKISGLSDGFSQYSILVKLINLCKVCAILELQETNILVYNEGIGLLRDIRRMIVSDRINKDCAIHGDVGCGACEDLRVLFEDASIKCESRLRELKARGMYKQAKYYAKSRNNNSATYLYDSIIRLYPDTQAAKLSITEKQKL
jgi:hypothetical protein